MSYLYRGIDLSYTSDAVKALINAIEYIEGCISEKMYEMDGPESYDQDAKDELIRNGEWEEEVARWKAPSERDYLIASGFLDGLEKANSLVQRVAIRKQEKEASDRADVRRMNRSYY